MRFPSLLSVGLLGSALVLTTSFAWSAGAISRPPAIGVAEVGANPPWAALSPAQQATLKPLAEQWATLDPTSKDKWLNVASRYQQLSVADQQRMQERMTQWAKLPPKARGEARLRFQQTRQLPSQERQEKWAAYQSLSSQDRQELAQKAQRKQQPVFLADNVAGPREQAQAFSGRAASTKVMQKKSNVVPNTLSSSPAQVAVAPTLIKAGRGATTTLINERPNPPMHQQTGLPKIAATKGFVDPKTLLPKKGPQGAAMAQAPDMASSPASATSKH